MTVLSRGARVRRGGRRPGWVLLTALLVLAMGASCALVFTNRVELLKLAVILALWAAAAGAFVSVMYRRQSDADQSRVRDLKLVYDLQLDREISARREYELTVESQLRRELASELRAQAADDIAALRAELTSLRTSLEILFDTDLEHRPALGSMGAETPPARAYSDWDRNGEATPATGCPAIGSRRCGQEDALAVDAESNADESAIIDVPEEPAATPPAGTGPSTTKPRARLLRRYAGAPVHLRRSPRMRRRRCRPNPIPTTIRASPPHRAAAPPCPAGTGTAADQAGLAAGRRRRAVAASGSGGQQLGR